MRLGIGTLILAAAVTSPLQLRSSASTTPHCSASRKGFDLTIRADASSIVVSGTVSPSADKLIRAELKRPAASRRRACVALNVTSSAVTDSENAETVIRFLARLHGGDTVRAIWGGGGITFVGWLHDDSYDARPTGRHTDFRSIGRLDSLPAPALLRNDILNLSPNRMLQVEQFHPAIGPVRVETTSRDWLEVCPGGWRGQNASPDASWWGVRSNTSDCIPLRAGRSAILPDSPRSDFHYSIAIRARHRVVDRIDVTLIYTAVDLSAQCFLAGYERPCDVVAEPSI